MSTVLISLNGKLLVIHAIRFSVDIWPPKRTILELEGAQVHFRIWLKKMGRSSLKLFTFCEKVGLDVEWI